MNISFAGYTAARYGDALTKRLLVRRWRGVEADRAPSRISDIRTIPESPSMSQPRVPGRPALRPLPNFIFMSRWLQLPLYLGLILAQCVYVYHFWVELIHLIEAAMGSSSA